LALVSAAAVYSQGWGFYEPEQEEPLLAWVHTQKLTDAVFLIPAKFPTPPPRPGVYSKTFTRPDPSFSDLARFRLATRQPIFVDFKSIPYRDVEVLEWYRRMQLVEAWYQLDRWTDTTRQAMEQEGITHLILKANDPRLMDLDAIYQTPRYVVAHWPSASSASKGPAAVP
jgi:hypothetical protein